MGRTSPADSAFPEGTGREKDFLQQIADGLGDLPVGYLFLAAVSGGADSTALLAAMADIAREKGFALHCLHVDHGIREEAERRADADAVRSLCANMGVPCAVSEVPPGLVARTAKERGLGMEAAARRFRRRAWNKEAARIGAACVLTAHTEDDLLETVLMRFLRGSGSAGLVGIRREMPRRNGEARVLRPMLSLSRRDVISYLEERKIPFRTDSTNSDIQYLRNRIRHKLIPVLDEFFPYWRKNVRFLAETQRLTADFLADEAARRLVWRTADGAPIAGVSADSASIDAGAFFAMPEILREEALFAALDRIAGEEATPPRRAVIRLFSQGKANAVQSGGVRASNEKNTVVVQSHDAFLKQAKNRESGAALLIKKAGSYIIDNICIDVTEGAFPAVLYSQGGKIALRYSGGQSVK